jgi:hypothetical protein
MRCAVTTPTEGQIVVCDEGPEPSDGKIVVCDEGPEPSDGKIVVCDKGTEEEEEQPVDDPCEVAGAPGIVSPSAGSVVTGHPDTGTLIQVSGGIPPYSVSYSKGSVSQISALKWRITALSSCGSPGSPAWGTITVTDACGRMATRDVRNTGGIWCCLTPNTPGACPANVRFECTANNTGSYSGGRDCYCLGLSRILNGYSYTVGGYRYTDNIRCRTQGALDTSPSCDLTPLDGSNPCNNPCGGGAGDPEAYGCVSCVVGRWVEEWRCP